MFTKYRINTSAVGEINRYPFLIHLFMTKVENQFIQKYFSLFFEILFILIVYKYLSLLKINANTVMAGLIILSISTTSFAQVRFFSARVLGLIFFNLILLTTYADIPLYYKVVIEIFCLTPIFLGSKFAHQAYVFVVLPVALLFFKTDLLISYPAAIIVSFVLTKGFVKEVFKAHIMHCYWSFHYHMDYYVFGRYYRDFESEPVIRKELSFGRTLNNLAALIKNPVLIFIPFMLIFSDVSQLNFNLALIIVVLFIYVLLAIFARLNRSIGSSERYFEYIMLPLVMELNASKLFDHNLFFPLLGVVFFASIFWVCFMLRKQNRSLRESGRVFDNFEIKELMKYLDSLPSSVIVSLPISISNFLAMNEKHKFFYPYSFFAQYFLCRVGILPYFKFDNNNLLNKKYIDYLVADIKRVPSEHLGLIIEKYKYELEFKNSSYHVYKKVK